ncbi:MAG: bifunctional (p)ppGpp synthetase/guanosine-3',5'-bis(diphosphate) 3'-pyrophosphohydrolase [Actinobacteria bacterium]|nr:bifunctional (p)ppGpp synthetase/guanosine-3',5'-bis(diphosphate) 3'-pyrophosphohydrolase [Actinomycetota bacterium]NBO06794.1 bifunctional (p)ppGpp synthetase/guanosine-3',5'-bis(diphosphate) 3'-pyrophosphohydrolase [Actinomycetota bacterium]NBP12445.1 bifunctional (p)ppGpp synthetase/guanosine-3',5'-bis(diphosphate) 3'-pyrophosphohydrolase [Actinomycetota bacterium]NBP22074.1 bifunctional (p)ppGpp synthetase/guanosine-3',5'-bis(diphosphate) 3'-pyrophosphohydrolase [Actinomycetota bacterium]
MNALITPVINRLRENQEESDTGVVERAFEVAERAHKGQLRKSGDPYITHPVAVAEILLDFGLDANSIAAALLHDTVEDTSYSQELLRKDFGSEVAALVDGVTKLDRLTYGPTAEAETVRKMVVAMAKDIRVLVIKLADRLHNARTWQYVDPDSAERKARETLDIYAPLAHRLGMNAVKWELEDLSFKFIEPKKFEEIERLVQERHPSRAKLTNEVIALVEQDLSSESIAAKVTGRQKHLYSVYQKMVIRGREFNDIYDLVGIRVLVNDVRDCYAVLGAIHARWSPVPGRFKDYIAMPKFNLYQSLHTTVIGPNGKAVEIQIRTHDMHSRAEYGIAAHWKYKLAGSSRSQESPDMLWLKQLHEWQQETSDVTEFLDALRFDLRTPETFVFTPKGSVIALPLGATAVDFAYAVHTDVGNRCIGAKVNGKLVSLEAPLVNGDVVEVLTNKAESASPSRDWLNFVKSSRARSKIKAWFSKERREEAIDAGRESIARQMRKAGLPLQKILGGHSLLQLAHDLNYPDIDALYAAVGDGHISANHVIERLESSLGLAESYDSPINENITTGSPSRISRRGTSGIIVEGVDDVLVKLARCCTPVPGDAITGFITRGNGVSVHRSDCVNVADLKFHQGDRITAVKWDQGAKSVFLVNIQIEALDRARLLSDITRALSDQEINIVHAAVNTTKDQVAFSRFTFEMADASHLEAVLASVRKIEGVYDVYRITNN